jgi:hypothetical protein
MNGIGDFHDEIIYSLRYDQHGVATVIENHKLKGTLWERMELQHFPVDTQSLSIWISTACPKTEMQFVKNSAKTSGVIRRVFTDEQEWYLFGHVDIEISEQTDQYLDHGGSRSVVVCSCHAARSVDAQETSLSFA